MKSNYFIFSKNIISDLGEEDKFLLPRDHLTYHHQRGLFEESLINWVQQFCDKSKVFIDIGAHTGTYSINLAPFCKNVYAFEPQRSTFYALCGSVALSGHENIECVRKGLGSPFQRGKKKLFIYSGDGGGSSIHEKQGILSTEEIEITTLDDYNVRDIGFIKVDVEGNEYDAILGASITIKSNNYPRILFECNDGIPENLKDLLSSLGYKTSRITGYPNMYLAAIS